jgi:hypothetical protein
MSRLAVCVLFSVLSAPGFAQTPPPTRDDYLLLQRWRCRAEPLAVPSGGLKWSFKGASWSFESGRFWLAEPTSGGAVTGLVFEGKGRFSMEVPDPIELTQLRRFTKRPDLVAVDQPFTSMVLRTSGELPLSPTGTPPAGAFQANKLARERHEQWLTLRLQDVDARIVAALSTPGDLYATVDMKTVGFDWLTWSYDAERMEEIRLESFNRTYPYLETWLSVDEQLDDRGRPASELRPAIDILHVDLVADLTRAGRDKDWMLGEFQAGVVFTPAAEVEGARAVQFHLSALAKVSAVSEGGKPLAFLRDHVGGRRAGYDNRIYDDSLVVLLDEPLSPGKERRLDVVYELELLNYARGRAWYPWVEGDETLLRDTHTARLELTVRKKHEVRAMGRKEDDGGKEKEEGAKHTTVWTADEPVKMLTFSFADHFVEETVRAEGTPEVIAFGSRQGIPKSRFYNTGVDVANSAAFFQKLLGADLPPRPLYVTSIDGGHGQSFDGFIHMSEASFDVEQAGATELFRAHEVAHQWWGHLVGASSYRDAWLGEAFAEYSAMMFVEATVKDGPKLFQEIVRVYGDGLNGSIKTGFSKFARPGVTLLNRAYGDRIGPIGHGWRANTGEVPTAYSSQVYEKGALVLHMLRGLLHDMTKSDEAFIEILRDFVRTHRGGYASTRDFEAAVTRRAPADWSWYFDQWVFGTAIPTYRWNYDLAATPDAKGEYAATLRVRQSDVPPGFKMPVPVAVELPSGKTGRLRILVDEPDETFTLSFPERPKSLTFNPDSEVLAKTRRD